MVFADEVLLTDSDKMGHFAFDEVPNPDWTDVSGIEMEGDRMTYR